MTSDPPSLPTIPVPPRKWSLPIEGALGRLTDHIGASVTVCCINFRASADTHTRTPRNPTVPTPHGPSIGPSARYYVEGNSVDQLELHEHCPSKFHPRSTCSAALAVSRPILRKTEASKMQFSPETPSTSRLDRSQ